MLTRHHVRRVTWATWRALQGSFLNAGAQGLPDPNGAQCTHVPNYLWRSLGAGQLFGSAFSWIGRSPDGCVWLPFASWRVIRSGDVVVFRPELVGPFGHVDVALDGRGYAWLGMDQNWPIGAPVSAVRHTRDEVAGIIRVRGI